MQGGVAIADAHGGCTLQSGGYEYMVLVTTLPYSVEATAQLYRDRADSENLLTNSKTNGAGAVLPHTTSSAAKLWPATFAHLQLVEPLCTAAQSQKA